MCLLSKTLLFASLLFWIGIPNRGYSQSSRIIVTVSDSSTKDELQGVRVKVASADEDGPTFGGVSDGAGQVMFGKVPPGQYQLAASSSGYAPFKRLLTVAGSLAGESISIRIYLIPIIKQAEEVVVSGTRSERSIDDVPVRVEIVSQEEIEEKVMEKPSSVIELLNESAGTRIQETSATAGSANIRIQGLDGRYTQVLIDGIPSASGLGSGFGLTQLAPLNLRRVEIIKGASSALYGPDAIAGLLNFITKNPAEQPEFDAVLNASSRQGYDASAFYGQMFDEFGGTLLVAFSKQAMVDVDGDGFSDIPQSTRFAVIPKLNYELVDNLTGTTTMTYLHEERLGGMTNATESSIGTTTPWSESNKSNQIDLAQTLSWRINKISSASLQLAGMRLERNSYFGASPFDGVQNTRFADAQYETAFGDNRLQVGAAYTSDNFEDQTPNVVLPTSYSFADIGGWAQDDITFSKQWELLGSLRYDIHNVYGSFVTPRASIMYRPDGALTFHFGAGTGFKAPTIFLEDAELYGFHNIRPLIGVQAEQARSASFDANYHAPIGDVAAKFDLALFATQLDHALLINNDSLESNIIYIRSATGPTVSRGVELTAGLSLEDIHFSLGYTYLDTRQTNGGNEYQLELNPKHWLGIAASYEDEEEGIKAGVEGYFTGEQRVEENPFRSTTPPYWLIGALVEKAFGPVHIFLNAENLFDVRQTRYEPIYSGVPGEVSFRPLHLWVPLEGRTINGGIRIAIH